MMTDMKTEQSTMRTYVAPDTSVRQIKMELSFLASTAGATLGDMDPNDLYDEDF